MMQKQNSDLADPARMGFERSVDGKVWLDCRFRMSLSQAGLADFEEVMSRADGRCTKYLEDREVWHFRICAAAERTRGLYVKKHHVRTWKSRLRALLGLRPGPTPGCIEAANVAALATEGIAVMPLLAYGEKHHADGLHESFVITEELENYTELHHYLCKRFAAQRGSRRSARDRDLRRLIGEIAGIVRQFHAAGYNHRDLYCRHFFVRDTGPLRREIRLIDLQRVQRRRWFRRRWIVKDLAQLAWSAPLSCIKRTHKIAFMREYLGVDKLRPVDKRLIRAVLAKQRRMEKRLGMENN